MTGLTDIAPERTSVDVQGHSLEVAGVTVRDLAGLLRRFPELRHLFSGGETAIEGLAATLPDLVAAVIACGIGCPGDQDQEDAAARLPAEAQSKLFGAIMRLTMPGGIGPFVEGLAIAFGSPIPATTLANGSLAQSSN